MSSGVEAGVEADADKRRAITANMNLAVLRRLDPAVNAILSSSSQVAVYNLPAEEEGQEAEPTGWKRCDIEGSLYIVSRDVADTNEARHRVVIVNRKTPSNFSGDITAGGMKFDTADQMIMFQDQQGLVTGLWFYVAEEIQPVLECMTAIVDGSPPSPPRLPSPPPAPPIPASSLSPPIAPPAAAQLKTAEPAQTNGVPSSSASENTKSQRGKSPSRKELHLNDDAAIPLDPAAVQPSGNGEDLSKYFPNLKLTNGVAGDRPPSTAVQATTSFEQVGSGHVSSPPGIGTDPQQAPTPAALNPQQAPTPAALLPQNFPAATAQPMMPPMPAPSGQPMYPTGVMPLPPPGAMPLPPPGAMPLPPPGAMPMYPLPTPGGPNMSPAGVPTMSPPGGLNMSPPPSGVPAMPQFPGRPSPSQHHQMLMMNLNMLQRQDAALSQASQTAAAQPSPHQADPQYALYHQRHLQSMQQRQVQVRQHIHQVQAQLAMSHPQTSPSYMGMPPGNSLPRPEPAAELPVYPAQAVPRVDTRSSANGMPASYESQASLAGSSFVGVAASAGAALNSVAIDRNQFRGLLQRMLSDKKLFEVAFSAYVEAESQKP